MQVIFEAVGNSGENIFIIYTCFTKKVMGLCARVWVYSQMLPCTGFIPGKRA